MSQNKNQRCCCVVHCKNDKSHLLRLVVVNNELKIDNKQSLKGHGFYLSKQALEIDSLNLQKALQKKLRMAISLEMIEQIKQTK